jgi:hypothetical protein
MLISHQDFGMLLPAVAVQDHDLSVRHFELYSQQWLDPLPSASERMLHGIGGISAPCHAMPLLLTNMPFYVNYLVE